MQMMAVCKMVAGDCVISNFPVKMMIADIIGIVSREN